MCGVLCWHNGVFVHLGIGVPAFWRACVSLCLSMDMLMYSCLFVLVPLCMCVSVLSVGNLCIVFSCMFARV